MELTGLRDLIVPRNGLDYEGSDWTARDFDWTDYIGI